MAHDNDWPEGATEPSRLAADGSQELLVAMAHASADAMIIENLDGVVIDWNMAAEHLYGYKAEEVIGRPLTMLVPPYRLDPAEEWLARARQGEQVADVETERWTKDGRRIDVSLSIAAVRDDAGEIIATSAIVRDITTRTTTDQALAASEALLEVAFEDAPIGMVVASPELRTLRVNRALCAMLGVSAEEILASNVWTFMHPEDIAPYRACIERALSGEITNYQLETRYVHRDGDVVWGLLNGSLIRDGSGEPRSVVSQIQDITERKRAEAKLAAAHQTTREVLERITDHFYALDQQWRLTYVNDATARLAGRSPEELLGKRLWDLSTAAAREILEPAFEQALTSGLPRSIEFFHATRGTWYDVRIYPTSNGVSVFFRDVTESRLLTEELRASETRYRTLIEQLPGAVYLLANDADQTPLYFSPYIERITGETPEESMLLRDLWFQLVHPEDRERVAEADERHGEVTDLFQVEYRHRHKDGSYVWVRDECVPVYDDTGQAVAWQGVMLDITDRMQATQTQAQLAALVESAEDAIVSGTVDGTITSWNGGAERLYGYRAEEMIGTSFRRLLPDDPVDPAYEQLLEAVRSGRTTDPLETTRKRKDGTTFAASVSLSTVRDHTGAISGISSITQDITERKRAEAVLQQALIEAEAANAAKSQFLAMMSHELRTPLQAVLGYSEFLLANPASTLTADEREDLEYIQQGGQRMLTLINQLLDLSRLEAGRVDVAHEPVDLADILEQVRQDVGPRASQKGLDLRIGLPSSLPPILGDSELLRQIVLNLVGNAVKFTERGTVSIEVKATGAEVTVQVADTGIGIAEDALPQIFEAFYQVDSRLTRRHGGAGLGLAIAQKLAALMDGQITVQSERGSGTTFRLTLPMSAASTPSSPGRDFE